MTTTGVISYPIPAYQNLPIEAQNYQPSRFVISAISLGVTTTITTTSDLNYVIGQLVRILIPSSFGTIQLNEQQGYVIALPASNQATVNIDSSHYDPFISSSGPSQAQILAIGDINSGVISSTGRSIRTVDGNTNTAVPGAFINISPQ